MDVADRIVLMDKGKIEQVGPPRELYEHPANEFVMGFIGEVNRLDDGWVRPHDIDILLDEVPGLGRGADRARRLPGLRGARRAGASRRLARLGAGAARSGRAARAAPGPDRQHASARGANLRADDRHGSTRNREAKSSVGLRDTGLGRADCRGCGRARPSCPDRRRAPDALGLARRSPGLQRRSDSRTDRRLARTAIQTSVRRAAAPLYVTFSGRSPRTLASGPSTARMTSASEISVPGRARA